MLVSGGQSGVDRAALDVALELADLGIGYAGWCPADGWAEDLPDPPGLRAPYPLLRETPTRDPAERTVRNVRDSDATLVVRPDGAASPGTDLAGRTARHLGRPLLVSAGADPHAVLAWLRDQPAGIRLHVAGPRASEWPDGYGVTRGLLLAVLRGPLGPRP